METDFATKGGLSRILEDMVVRSLVIFVVKIRVTNAYLILESMDSDCAKMTGSFLTMENMDAESPAIFVKASFFELGFISTSNIRLFKLKV